MRSYHRSHRILCPLGISSLEIYLKLYSQRRLNCDRFNFLPEKATFESKNERTRWSTQTHSRVSWSTARKTGLLSRSKRFVKRLLMNTLSPDSLADLHCSTSPRSSDQMTSTSRTNVVVSVPPMFTSSTAGGARSLYPSALAMRLLVAL